MTREMLLSQVLELKNALAHIETHMQETTSRQDVVRELQTAVDTTRRSVWTVLKAMHTDHYEEYVASFRARRASDLLETVLDDIDAGASPGAAWATTLRETLHSIVTTAANPATEVIHHA